MQNSIVYCMRKCSDNHARHNNLEPNVMSDMSYEKKKERGIFAYVCRYITGKVIIVPPSQKLSFGSFGSSQSCSLVRSSFVLPSSTGIRARGLSRIFKGIRQKTKNRQDSKFKIQMMNEKLPDTIDAFHQMCICKF